MNRKILSGISVLSIFLLSIFMGGCGSGKKEGVEFPTQGAVRIDNTACTNSCHAATLDLVTGKNLVFEWNSSAHAKGAAVVDCQSCHGGGSLHWGIGPIPFPNPDDAGICSTCHSNSPDADLRPSSAHFPNLTPAILASPVIWDNMTTAAYVTSQNANKCRTCHNPHNNSLLQQNFDWRASAHAAIKEAPWIHYDFKARDVCNRCHTTTGYVKYLTTGDTKAWAAANSSDKTKEVLRCDGCHQDYSWKRRSGITAPDGVSVPYGTFSSAIPSPAVQVQPFGKINNSSTSTIVADAGDADLCINCHTGTNSGRGIDTAPASILTGSFAPLNSHYFGAAGDLYALNGFEYRTHETYFKPASDTIPGFEHYWLGTAADDVFGPTRGPCVTCHIFIPGNHLLTAVIQTPSVSGPRGIINGTITAFPGFSPGGAGTGCSNCHGPLPNDDDAPDIGFGGVADIRLVKAQYASRLAALEAALNTKGIFYNPDVYPYFFDSNGNTFGTVTPWPDKGTLGAAFNLNNLTREPGGYVHDHWYTALLIYDSLDFLDDGLQNNSYSNPALFPTGRALSGPLF